MIEVHFVGEFGNKQRGGLNSVNCLPSVLAKASRYHRRTPLKQWVNVQLPAMFADLPHFHHDVEIITYVRRGIVTFRDDNGILDRLPSGQMQLISAGTGHTVTMANLGIEPADLFILLITADLKQMSPMTSFINVTERFESSLFVPLASGLDEDVNVLRLRADVRFAAASIEPGRRSLYRISKFRSVYLIVESGVVAVNGRCLAEGHGAFVSRESKLEFESREHCKIFLIDYVP